MRLSLRFLCSSQVSFGSFSKSVKAIFRASSTTSLAGGRVRLWVARRGLAPILSYAPPPTPNQNPPSGGNPTFWEFPKSYPSSRSALCLRPTPLLPTAKLSDSDTLRGQNGRLPALFKKPLILSRQTLPTLGRIPPRFYANCIRSRSDLYGFRTSPLNFIISLIFHVSIRNKPPPDRR